MSGGPGTAARTTWKPAALAIGTGLAVFAVGTVAESLIVRAVDGNPGTLEWLSDGVISAGFAGITYLWLRLKATRAHLLEMTLAQAAVDEQLRLAAEIQRGLLPAVPAATPGYRWAAAMIPASRIGGDFYDFLQPAAGGALAILVDVSGKGIPAALILSSLKTLFRSVARETTDPAAIAERISEALHGEYGGLPYATAIVARFEARPARVTYVNAGHPAGFLLRNGAVTAPLESGGHPLGLLPGSRYTTTALELKPNDVGVLVTDGITEALEAGPTTVGQTLGASRALWSSPADLCDGLVRAAAAGPGPIGVVDWHDDRTVFVFAVDPEP
jgi:stage II sporulation SpoE-like protein